MNAYDRLLPTPIRHLRLIAALLLSLLAVTASSASATAQDSGVVTGTVINKTTGEPIAAIDVTLSKFTDQTGQNSEDTSATTSADGSFRFEGLDTSDGLAYAVSTRYEDVLYGTTMILLSKESQQQADITVYETTTDQSSVSIPTRGIIVSGVDRETGLIAMTDAYTFAVDGDLTVVEGSDGYSVRFPVPNNVDNITPRQGFNFGTARVEETDVLVTTPLLPGETNAGLDYEFHYTGSTLEVPVSAAYQTDSLQILVPAEVDDAEIQVSAEGSPLLDNGIVPINDRDYHVWSASGLQPGATIRLSISGLPEPPTAHTLNTIEPAVLAGFALLAASAVTGWLVFSRGLHTQRPVVLAPAVSAPLDQRRELLSNELRELEATRQAGEIEDDAYRASRRAILEDLRSISRQYRGLGDDE
jgi:5-hydroxyisourate hydrolase-like protein (transthyretin family)